LRQDKPNKFVIIVLFYLVLGSGRWGGLYVWNCRDSADWTEKL